MSHGKFSTVINCMDGRTQLQVNDYMRKRYSTDHVDTITEPGPIKYLASGVAGDTVVESILRRTDISVHQHGSRSIGVIAHYDCAGNPVDEDIQRQQALLSVDFLRGRYPACEIIAIWVASDWKAVEIC